jgi:Flp pilus assembly protein CpaB
MKRNLMPLLGVAFVAAVVATGIFYGLLIPQLRGEASADTVSRIVVASRSVNRGATLQAEDLRLTDRPASAGPDGTLSAIDQAVGLTVLEPLAPNQPVSPKALAARNGGGPSVAIPKGTRAVSIHPVSSSGVVLMLRSGSRIDIQVIDRRGVGQLSRMMEDVEVLSIQAAERDNPVVTVLVSPADADRLSYADSSMHLRVVARNPSDRSAGGPFS